MTNFLGEYYCKLDTKGRVMMPASLKKQVPDASEGKFVINRGFEKCLVLYTKEEWDKITAEINKLNQYVRKNREFIRYFYRGATELQFDSSSRLLLPKMLLTYAGIEKEAVLFANANKIEVWDAETYDNLINNEPEYFSELAEQVMGDLGNDTSND